MTTKKTFQAFAEAISKIRDHEDRKLMVNTCIRIFREDNPRFDMGRFVDTVNGLIVARDIERKADALARKAKA